MSTPSVEKRSTQSSPTNQPRLALTPTPMDQGTPKPNVIVGIYIGYGVNNGTPVWQGPKGGLFLRNRNDNRTSFGNRNLVQFY